MKPCSFHALRFNCLQVVLFSRLSCHFTEYVQVHQMVKDECLDDPQRRSQQCQRVPSVRVYCDKMIELSERRLSRFSPDAQPRPMMLSRINTKGAWAGLLAKQIANKRASLSVHCSDRDSGNASARCAPTKLHAISVVHSTDTKLGSIR